MKIERGIIHALDTYPDMDVGVKEVKRWHTDPKPKGNGWSDIGYHYVIRRDGTLEIGRRNEAGNYVAGAHVLGLNANSIGIALAGGKARKGGHPACNFTFAQHRTLESLVFQLEAEYPGIKWSGHYEHDKGKQCPTFDVKALLGLI